MIKFKEIGKKALISVMALMTFAVIKPQMTFADVRTSVEIPDGYDNNERTYSKIYIDGVAYDTVKSEFTVEFDVPEGATFAVMYKMIEKNGIWGPSAMTVWDVSGVRESSEEEEFSGDVDDFSESLKPEEKDDDEDADSKKDDDEDEDADSKDDEKDDDEDADSKDDEEKDDEDEDGIDSQKDEENEDDEDADSKGDDDEKDDDEDADSQKDDDGVKDDDEDADSKGDENKDDEDEDGIDPQSDEDGKGKDGEDFKDGDEKSRYPKVVGEFENLFMYKGFSVRITGEGGIRAKTGIKTSAKAALLSDEGLAGYKLVEYGQIAKAKDKLDSEFGGKFVIGDGISPARCYWKENNKTKDYYLSDSNDDYIVFANVLPVPASKFDAQVSFRAYAKLKRISDDTEVTIYGPVVTKSIYDVALSRLAASDINNSDRVKEKQYVSLVKGTVELKDGTIVFLGDGIMEGDLDGVNHVSTPFPDIVMSKLRENYYGVNIKMEKHTYVGGTLGIPGAYGYKGSMMKLSKDITTQNPKAIVIFAGNNDWHYRIQHQGTNRDPETGHFQGAEDCSAVFGSYEKNGLIKYANGQAFDPLTQKFEKTSNYYRPDDLNYCSGIWMTLDYLTETYPDTKIVLVTTTQSRLNGYKGSTYGNPNTGKKLWEYVDAEKAIAGYYKNTLHKKVYVIDLYYEWDGGKENSSSFYSYFESKTGNQPNQTGHNVIGDFVFNKLVRDVIEK